MAHASKYARGAVGNLARHYARKEREDGGLVRYGNQEIKPELSYLNYNLAPEREGGQVAFIEKRLSEVRHQNRADLNVMCSWVVTVPKLPDDMNTMERDVLERQFFDRTYQFLKERYGEENVVSAYVHMDETTPHVHFAFVPVVYDKKRGDLKVSAKECLTRTELKSFHPDLESHLDGYGGFKYIVLNEATKDGNRTVAELKMESAHREVEAAQQEALEARQTALTLAEGVNTLKGESDALRGEIAVLQGSKEELQEEMEYLTDMVQRADDVFQDKLREGNELDSEIRDKYWEAQQKAEEIAKIEREAQGRVKALETQETVLQGKIDVIYEKARAVEKGLKNLVSEKETEVKQLDAEIEELTEERDILREAVSKETEVAVMQFGSYKSMEDRIAEARVESNRRTRFNLLEKFVALPNIKPLFEQFLQLLSRNRNRNRDLER